MNGSLARTPPSTASPASATRRTPQGYFEVKVLIDHSISVDGFSTGPNVGVEHPMEDGGEQLHDWMFDRKTDVDAEVVDDIHAKIAAGRRRA